MSDINPNDSSESQSDFSTRKIDPGLLDRAASEISEDLAATRKIEEAEQTPTIEAAAPVEAPVEVEAAKEPEIPAEEAPVEEAAKIISAIEDATQEKGAAPSQTKGKSGKTAIIVGVTCLVLFCICICVIIVASGFFISYNNFR
jgi:uncharacterized membrane protein